MPAGVTIAQPKTLPIIRYAYYLFVFSIPLEIFEMGGEGILSVARIAGLLFLAVALLQPNVCFGKIPKPIGYFLAYVLVYVCVIDYDTRGITGPAILQLVRFAQLLVLFWIFYNMLQDKTLITGTFVAIVVGCLIVAAVMLGGSGRSIGQGRQTVSLGGANGVGATLSLGIIILFGLVYGRDGRGSLARPFRILGWFCFSALAGGIVATGSRGALVMGVAGILMFIVGNRGNVHLKARLAFMGLFAIAALVVTMYQDDAARARWERTMETGDQSRREAIHPAAWGMFLEKPLFGWGPVSFYQELGARFGKTTLDPHSVYLWILNETGLAGFIPFFIGVGMCLWSGWRAIHGSEGSLPIALLTSLCIQGFATGGLHLLKLFWIVLAYNLASGVFVSRQFRVPNLTDSQLKR